MYIDRVSLRTSQVTLLLLLGCGDLDWGGLGELLRGTIGGVAPSRTRGAVAGCFFLLALLTLLLVADLCLPRA